VEREGGKEKLRNRNIFSPGLTANILSQDLVIFISVVIIGILLKFSVSSI
jgi:hypothetical protein